MSTSVYLSGGLVVVEKSGETALSIRQSRAAYLIQGDVITIYDTIVLASTRTDLVVNIQDSIGNTFASTQALINYLSVFILVSSFKQAVINVSTEEKQNEIIAQNTTIQGQLTDLDIDLDVLENIKSEQKESNKILKKIYNSE